MQTRLSIISNIIFKYFVIFAIAFLWLNFYVDNILIVGLIALIISLVIGNIMSIINKKKNYATSVTIKEQEHIKNISFQLLLTELEDIIRFYSILLKAKHEIAITKDKQAIYWQDVVFVPIYNTPCINIDVVAELYKKHKNFSKIIIAGISFTDDAMELSHKITDNKITLLDEQSTFKLFKKYDFYPDSKIKTTQKEKFNFKNIRKTAFMKSNAKHYLYSGIIILITSFFIKYNIYYLIFASLLFIFALICRFKPHKTLPTIFDEL